MKKKTKVELKTETTRDAFIYARVETELIKKIDEIRTKKKYRTRSQAIRSLLVYAFEAGAQ